MIIKTLLKALAVSAVAVVAFLGRVARSCCGPWIRNPVSARSFLSLLAQRRIIGLCCIVAVVSAGMYAWLNAVRWERDDREPVLIEIKEGTAAAYIPSVLAKQGIYVNPKFFRLAVMIQGLDRNLMAGVYQVTYQDTSMSFAHKLAKFQAYLFSWRLNDGATYWELRRTLDQASGIKHETVSMTQEELLAKLGSEYKHMEGLFAPNTYHFHYGTSDLKVLTQAYNDQQKILQEEWANRDDHTAVKTPYEALILASIVEREVARKQDRFIVAGIFNNRLKLKMRLQTDPTVIYGEGERFSGSLKRKHLNRATAYNTYRIAGLPPTPIGNPTRESIHAVLHPAEHEYLFFINKANGDLVPSKTLDEHNWAVNRYIRNK